MSDTTASLTPLFPTSGDPAFKATPVQWSAKAKPLGGLHAWLRGALIAFAVVELFMAGLNGSLLWIYAALEGGFEFSDIQLNLYDFLSRYAGIAATWLFYGCYLLAIIMFCRFIYRAIRNLDHANARGDRMPASWAVAYNFIPLMNIWKPYQAMEQAWRGSLDPNSNRIGPPAAMMFWWLTWLASNAIATISFRIALSSGAMSDQLSDFNAYRLSLWLDITSSVLSVVSVVSLLVVIKGITRAQDQHARSQPPISQTPPSEQAEIASAEASFSPPPSITDTFRLPSDFGPPNKSSIFLRLMLLMNVGVLIWAAWVNVEMIQYVQDVMSGTYESRADLFANSEPIEEMAAAVPRAMNGQYILCAIAYLAFVYAAAGNLEEARAARFKRSAEGAVGVSFIPLANFVMIYQVMRDIWVSSLDPVQGIERPTNLLPFWWMTFLVGTIGGRFIDLAASNAQASGSTDVAITWSWIGVGALIISAVSCLLLFAIVRRITRAQKAWRNLRVSAQPAVGGP